MLSTRFDDRKTAGRALAQALRDYQSVTNLLILALPRGGVPVAAEIAAALAAPLDLVIVRKLGLPAHKELAMGAIASGGVRILNDNVIYLNNVTDLDIKTVEEEELRELTRRERAYRGNRPPPDIQGKVVLLVDDGLATGATMMAAIEALRQHQPQSIVVAVPVAPPDTVRRLQQLADQVVCVHSPEPFFSIGQWYVDFEQTSDDEVHQCLRQAWSRQAQTPVAELSE